MMVHFDVGTWRPTDKPCILYAVEWQTVQFVLHYWRNMVTISLLYDQLYGCIKNCLQSMQMHSSSMEEDSVAVVDASDDEHVD